MLFRGVLFIFCSLFWCSNGHSKIHSMYLFKFENNAQCWLAFKELERNSGKLFTKMGLELFNKFKTFQIVYCPYSEDIQVWNELKLDYQLQALLYNIYPYIDDFAFIEFIKKYQEEIEVQPLQIEIPKIITLPPEKKEVPNPYTERYNKLRQPSIQVDFNFDDGHFVNEAENEDEYLQEVEDVKPRNSADFFSSLKRMLNNN